MKEIDFQRNPSGVLQKITTSSGSDFAFIPNCLPPKLTFNSNEIINLIIEARADIGELEGNLSNLPDPNLLIQPLKYSEAQMSSDLEGTTVDLIQLVAYELNPKDPKSINDPKNATREVSNLKKALDHWTKIQGKMPICTRLLKDLHKILLGGVRGTNRNPGNFRNLQVQISGGRFIPPPVTEIERLLTNLENFINSKEDSFLPLIKSIITHYQFETIHPFQDGNGRVGRLLFSIMIAKECEMVNSVIYLSPFFNKNRKDYLNFLYKVSTESDWDTWIKFCLLGISLQAKGAIIKCLKLRNVRDSFYEKLEKYNNSRLRFEVDSLFINPIITIKEIKRKYNVGWHTARSDLRELTKMRILDEVILPGVREKYYFNKEILDIIKENG